jgi:SRSO17 transposase
VTDRDEGTAASASVDAERDAWVHWLDVLARLLSPVFAQAGSRRAGFDYARALLRVLERRSCWQLAEIARHLTPRRLQGLLSEYVWKAETLVARVRELVVDELGDPDGVLALDETAEIKRGKATVGVARQYAGITGQVENCQTVVFLAYVAARAHTLIDFALYLPKQWADDLERRREAGVPDDVTFATKPELAVGLLRRAVHAAVPFAWVVADEVYGRATELRAYIESIARGYVLAIPVNFMVTVCEGAKPCTVDQAAKLVPDTAWEERSCGKGCKGHRYYQWALLATASPTHKVLLRRHPDRPDQVTYLYVFVPPQRPATLATIVKIAGRRWPCGGVPPTGQGPGRPRPAPGTHLGVLAPPHRAVPGRAGHPGPRQRLRARPRRRANAGRPRPHRPAAHTRPARALARHRRAAHPRRTGSTRAARHGQGQRPGGPTPAQHRRQRAEPRRPGVATALVALATPTPSPRPLAPLPQAAHRRGRHHLAPAQPRRIRPTTAAVGHTPQSPQPQAEQADTQARSAHPAHQTRASGINRHLSMQ